MQGEGAACVNCVLFAALFCSSRFGILAAIVSYAVLIAICGYEYELRGAAFWRDLYLRVGLGFAFFVSPSLPCREACLLLALSALSVLLTSLTTAKKHSWLHHTS